MKRIMYLLLILVVVFTLSCCGNKPAEPIKPVNFYYRTVTTTYGADATIITAEARESQGYEDNYQYLIEQYLNGPRTYDCISPFPAGTTMEEFSISSSKVQIMLSTHMSLLSGAELMLACACLTRTVCELTGINTVQISSDGGMLNNEESITLTNNSFTYLDFG